MSFQWDVCQYVGEVDTFFLILLPVQYALNIN